MFDYFKKQDDNKNEDLSEQQPHDSGVHPHYGALLQPCDSEVQPHDDALVQLHDNELKPHNGDV